MTHTGDRKAIASAEKAANALVEARGIVVRSLLSTVEGREWYWSLLESAHIFAPSFTRDPYQTAFSEGERNIGLRLLADIMMHCPDQYIQAQQEANVRRTLDERRSRPNLDRGDPGPSDPADDLADPGWDDAA